MQFNAREWVPGLRCWRCGRLYDEENTPPYVAELLDASERAMVIRTKDPAAADRLMAEAEQRAEAMSIRERSDLRERAPHDLQAALLLRSRLQSDLNGLARGRRMLEREARTEPQAGVGVHNLEAEVRSLASELATVEATIRRLSAEDEDGSHGSLR